jgi:catechol 2,3-dioxygenase-like lactoylglutathione lyase family enzyme
MSKQDTRPFKISHIGIQTYDIAAIRDWYCKVLGGQVVVEHLPYFSTVSFDDEHHRIAIAGLPGEPVAKNGRAAGIFHVALTFGSILDLLKHYEHVRDLGIRPEKVLHHGPTVSMYYRDPDGNECELIVDRFKTGEETKEFMRGPVFSHTLGAGGHFDPEVMLTKMKAGASEAELLYYDEEAAMKVDIQAELASFQKMRGITPPETT